MGETTLYQVFLEPALLFLDIINAQKDIENFFVSKQEFPVSKKYQIYMEYNGYCAVIKYI